MRAALLVPIKDFRQAKLRLAGVLDPPARRALARHMAAIVLRAAGSLPTHVVCDDADVAAWAADLGAEVLWRPGHGLNGAVTDGVTTLAAMGFDRVVVSHSDLPLARDLAWAATGPNVVLVPDRHDDGTNVACVPAAAGFTFQYGPGSYRRHAAEARRLGLGVHVVRHRELGWDVDLPTDLDHPALQEVLSSLPTIPASPS
jgi:2-phospho-L-lactate guanylyltransferase